MAASLRSIEREDREQARWVPRPDRRVGLSHLHTGDGWLLHRKFLSVVSCVCVDSRPEASRCGCVASTRTFKGRPKPTQRTCPQLPIMCGCLLGAISPWYNNVARFKIRRPRSGELIRLEKLNSKAKMASRKTANVYEHQTDLSWDKFNISII
jgi:hypothetical protein